MSAQLAKARQALGSSYFDVSPRDPFAGAMVRIRRGLGLGDRAESVLQHWKSVHPGSPTGEMRYRWPLTHERIEVPDYAAPSRDWRPWRPSELEVQQRDVFDFEGWLTTPIVLTECGELLGEIAGGSGDMARTAAELCAEALPIMRRDFAKYIQGLHPWTDTLALWCLTGTPTMLARLHPVAYAIAVSYAPEARANGLVLGKRFPFHDKPMASATAQLAAGLLTLGTDLDLVASMAGWLHEHRRPSGGWGDETDEEDVLSTLMAGDLLLHVDPSFDPAPTAEFLLGRQTERGLWTVYGPETPWLTSRILSWFEATRKPFSDRFRWPYLNRANLDQKTGLPFFAWFIQIAELFGELGGISGVTTDVAFVDLAGFRAFNNQHGQQRGDQVIEEFARALGTLPHTTAIRDGGDEFLIVGAPTRTGLAHDLDVLRHEWPARFRERFGEDADPVAPRILVTSCRCDALSKARDFLGRSISMLKARSATPSPEGILEELSVPG